MSRISVPKFRATPWRGYVGRVNYDRYTVEFVIDNLFNRQYYTFGIEAANSLGPYGANSPPASPTVVPFFTPSFPRSFSLSLSARL